MRRKYTPQVKKNSSFSLNITSMTDMFTILLVFLLQNYSTSEFSMEPDKDVRLPASASEANIINGVKIILSKKYLKIDDRIIAELDQNDFSKSSLEINDSSFIKPLHHELTKYAESNKDQKFVKDGTILFQADKDLPYSTLKKVMYTSAMAGFPQLKLITIIGE
ncbi:MAG TPA: biopolymer transporter ExbD [Pseudobdellovibrionaceae bacterium]|nr:biopolymer transporter ExbD [Pseudobdellovibrionaceae bacterium]